MKHQSDAVFEKIRKTQKANLHEKEKEKTTNAAAVGFAKRALELGYSDEQVVALTKEAFAPLLALGARALPFLGRAASSVGSRLGSLGSRMGSLGSRMGARAGGQATNALRSPAPGTSVAAGNGASAVTPPATGAIRGMANRVASGVGGAASRVAGGVRNYGANVRNTYQGLRTGPVGPGAGQSLPGPVSAGARAAWKNLPAGSVPTAYMAADGVGRMGSAMFGDNGANDVTKMTPEEIEYWLNRKWN